MPIGKNAINRVKNNGYSNVETSAPDMENSVIANPDPQTVEIMIKPVEEKAAKTTPATSVEAAPTQAPKKAPAKKTTAKKAAKKTPAKDGFARVELGDGMPYYLL